MKRAYFRYYVYADRRLDDWDSSGYAEIGGDDFIVALGAFSHTNAKERGTFVHELGHNLALTHHGNGNNGGPDSVIYHSVMNYRYQFAGVPGTGTHTYSWGTQPCDPCTSSPKKACVEAAAAQQCSANQQCDCDKDDWSLLLLDVFGDPDYADGANSHNAPLWSQLEWGRHQDKKTILDHLYQRRAPVPKGIGLAPVTTQILEPPTQNELKARAKNIEARLGRQGAVLGVDYRLSADGTVLYAD